MKKKDSQEKHLRQNARYYFLMNLVKPIIRCFPGALGRKDGRTGLYPFMQAAAAATEHTSTISVYDNDETSITSFVFSLLRENPSLVDVKRL